MALSLGDSLSKTNPQYKYVIGLADKLENIYKTEDKNLISLVENNTILEIDKLNIPDFDNFTLKYSITELNTAVKPFYFNYFFQTVEDLEAVIFFDPDILVYSELKKLDADLEKYNFVITPHIWSPINDDFLLGEKHINNTGIYNLGFFAVKKSEESQRFINWWMDRLYKYCYIRFEEGLYVDQIWIHFLPIFFEKTLIERDLGYNVAYWNLHERSITKKVNSYYVNTKTELKFYHFSGFQKNIPNMVSKHQNRFTFEQRKDIKPIYDEFLFHLDRFEYDAFVNIECYYSERRKQYLKEKYAEKKNFIRLYKDILRKICLFIRNRILA
jgi:hypothetical protein